jgi:23S rRNA (uracil1939-C5)-methyltransferase
MARLPACPHRPPCPGCPRYGEPGLAPAALEALQSLARAHGLREPRVICGAPTGFRHRARLAIRGGRGGPTLGMFELGTHRVVAIPECSVQHPLINRVAAVVRQALVETGVSGYDEASHRGLARYLQVVVERASRTAQVVLVANTDRVEPLAACLDHMRASLGDALHSLWCNLNVARTNTILGPDFVRWCGPATVVERFGGAAVHYPPGAFGQNNLDVAERIVAHVCALVPQGSSVAEFHAGVGAIGLSLVDRVRALRMNELSPASLAGLALGLEALPADHRARIEVLPGPAGEARQALAHADTVIVDPPRKGLDAPLLDQLARRPPQRLIYVSCGLGSLLRETARLTAGGALRLACLDAFDLMPYTTHVETVAYFEREGQLAAGQPPER